ncbi:MAG: hypothetical protein KAH14_09115 [Clostridiales bacterium]|nr:hypothetical protein [Clostridiales bacterium]
MSNILSIVKISLMMAFRGQVGKKRKIKAWVIGLLMFIWIGPMIFSFSEIIKVMYELFDSFGQGDAIISIGLLVASTVVFMFGIFYTIGSYYMAKDIPTYLYMPVKSWELTSARFIIVLLYEYLTMLIFFLPVIVGYGIAAGMGVLYYLISLAIFILLPILPLALTSIIVMGIMSFAKHAMNKDRYTMVASLLGLGIGIGLNIGFQSLARSADNQNELQELLMSGKISMAENIARYFPGLTNATKALIDGDLLQLLIFIVIAATGFALFMIVAKAIYFKGVMGINQQVSRRDFDANKSSGFEAGSPVKTYLKKELRLIFRTPIFFMNLALIDFLMPVMLIVPILVSVGSSEFSELKNSIMRDVPQGILITGAFILFVFISAMNGITSTTISREGKQFQIMKFIPMSLKSQMDAKLLSGLVISMTGLLITLVFLVVYLKISVLVALLMLLAGTNAVILTRLTGFFIDAANPKLKWDNEVRAVKQNMNLLFNMLVGMGTAGVAVVFLIFVSQTLLVNALVFIIAMFAVNMGLYKLLEKCLPKLLDRIE